MTRNAYDRDWTDGATWVMATLFLFDRPLVAILVIVACFAVDRVLAAYRCYFPATEEN